VEVKRTVHLAHIKLSIFAQMEANVYPNTFLTVSREYQEKNIVFKRKVLHFSLGPAINVLT
jgi:hypothetical protein